MLFMVFISSQNQGYEYKKLKLNLLSENVKRTLKQKKSFDVKRDLEYADDTVEGSVFTLVNNHNTSITTPITLSEFIQIINGRHH